MTSELRSVEEGREGRMKGREGSKKGRQGRKKERL